MVQVVTVVWLGSGLGGGVHTCREKTRSKRLGAWRRPWLCQVAELPGAAQQEQLMALPGGREFRP